MLAVRGPLRRGLADLFSRRPAVPLAIALISGMLAERVMPLTPLPWLVVTLIALIAAGALFRHTKTASLLFFIATFYAGLTAAQLEGSYFRADHISHFTTDQARLA